MMKATAWFCPALLTLLCAARLVCTAQRSGSGSSSGDGSYANGYPLDYLDAQAIQDDYLLVKRNKPSLSIVNPLDVLRQRLLLEIARRQMKENTRQVELNRAILKNVGKRVFLGPSSLTAAAATRYYQQHHQHHQQQEQEQRAQLEQQHFPSELWRFAVPQPSASEPSPSPSRFLDFLQLQRPQAQPGHEREQLLADAQKSLSVVGMAKQQPNGNGIAMETNHGKGNRHALAVGKSGDTVADVEDEADDAGEDNELDNNVNWTWTSKEHGQGAVAELFNGGDPDKANGRLPWHLLYRLHKNKHYAN